MLCSQSLIQAFMDLDVRFWTGVPDSVLAEFCTEIATPAPGLTHVPAANEGNAIALAAGYHAATQTVPGVYLQNSGLGNAINPLTSLCGPLVYPSPMLLLMGWRGKPQTQDEPQHRQMGQVTRPLLDALGISSLILSADQAQAHQQIQQAHATATKSQAPVAVLVERGIFSKRPKPQASAIPMQWSREQAIEKVLESLPPQAIVVATTGKAGRELYELRKQRGEQAPLDFLNVGAMGHTSQVALGLALGQPQRPVICLDGDGSAIMHMGAMACVGHCLPPNLYHIVLNNGAHDSVGGQPSLASAIDLQDIARACGYSSIHRIEGPQASLTRTFQADAQGPYFIEIPIRSGARAKLGRPATPCDERQRAFRHALGQAEDRRTSTPKSA